MNTKSLLTPLAVLVTALMLSAPALAQEEASAEAGGETGGEAGGGGGSVAITDGGVVDMWRIGADFHLLAGGGGAAAGLKGFVDFPLHQFFLLGGEFSFAGGFGGALFEFNVKPTGRLPLSVGSGVLEPYITIPMGLAVWTGGGGAGFAWNVLFGSAYFFNDFIGIHGDLGVGGVTTGFGWSAFQLNLGAQFLF